MEKKFDNDFFIATSNFELQNRNSKTALNIIIPKGIKVNININDLTNINKNKTIKNNNLYFMENYEIKGLKWVPYYSDLNLKKIKNNKSGQLHITNIKDEGSLSINKNDNRKDNSINDI